MAARWRQDRRVLAYRVQREAAGCDPAVYGGRIGARRAPLDVEGQTARQFPSHWIPSGSQGRQPSPPRSLLDYYIKMTRK